ncbi:NADH dehydrogenase (ubiquinone) complex I, assembly factor 6, partial [Orchesella cincta]
YNSLNLINSNSRGACAPRNFSAAERKSENEVRNSETSKEENLDASSNSPEKQVGVGRSSYCAELVRKHEFENFLCALLLPTADIRGFVFAVRSFNVEIALIRDQVSQKDIGLARLAFWRDAINKVFANKSNSSTNLPRHPVVLELSRNLKDKTVSKKWFTNLIDAREQVMTDAAFKTLEDLETYCDKSVSPVLYLGLEALGVKNVDADHAASHLGKSIGLSNFIRSIPHNAQRRRVLIPQELLVKHKLSQENFIRFSNEEKIRDTVFEIASRAHIHYEKAKSLKPNISKTALPLMLVGTPTDIYLKRLRNSNFNPYHTSLNHRYGLLPLHLYYRKFAKVYY